MIRHIFTTGLLSAAVIFGQTQSTTETPAAGAASPAGSGSYTGVLLDANCQQLTSERNRSGMSGTSATSSTGAMTSSSSSSTSPTSSGTGNSTTSSTSSTRDYSAPAGGTSTSTSTTSKDSSSQSSTSQSSASNTQSGSSGTTGSGLSSGTTGSGYGAGTAGSSAGGGQTGVSTAQTGSSATNEASRSRSVGDSSNPVGWDTRYSACRVTPATTSFALYTGGKIVMLDPASNTKVQQQISSSNYFKDNSGVNRDMNVSVNGNMSGDSLQVTTISVQ